MVRILATVVLVTVALVVGAWQLGFVESPFDPSGTEAAVAPATALFDAAATGDESGVREALAGGVEVGARDPEGRTALMHAAAAGSVPALRALVEAGADLEATDEAGRTALMHAAAEAPDSTAPLLLLQAGADPTATDAEGRTPAGLAEDNGGVRNSGLYPRLVEAAGRPFTPGWPSGYLVPVEDATISSRASHLPGAPRAYRNGTHEGFDFYDGTVSVDIEYGTPQRAAAAGTVIRADTDYQPLTLEAYREIIEEATATLSTPTDVLDALRGRQVWIEHVGGFITRYAHLSGLAEGLEEGARVAQGQTVGFTGNSGTIEAAEGTEEGPHPHVEVWRGEETYLGEGLEPNEIYGLAAQVFGTEALPPTTDSGVELP